MMSPVKSGGDGGLITDLIIPSEGPSRAAVFVIIISLSTCTVLDANT